MFENAVRRLHEEERFDPSLLAEEAVTEMIRETYGILREAMDTGVADGVIPPVMARKLTDSLFLFSGFKTAQELREASALLRKTDGTLKEFAEFLTDVRRIDATYNVHYLEAEYDFAIASAQMAASWAEAERQGDQYDLQYRTAGDDRVREEHIRLDGITLPVNDPFWRYYYPPNGWGCRCTVVQVVKNKYPNSDPEEAMRLGERTTDTPKKRIFRFNPGIDGQLFPPKHPYYKLSQQEKEKVQKTVIELMLDPIETPAQLADELNRVGGIWFEHGGAQLFTTKRPGVNGYTYMDGRIYLTEERMRYSIDGVNHLAAGEDVLDREADALATLWHEVTHNRNKPGNMLLTSTERRYMELANEFVARKTLPDFFNAMGGELKQIELTRTRPSTGYNSMVCNYDTLIDATGADREIVTEAVQSALFNMPYNKQKEGLVDALLKGGAKKKDGTTLKKRDINGWLKDCREHSEEYFAKLIAKLL